MIREFLKSLQHNLSRRRGRYRYKKRPFQFALRQIPTQQNQYGQNQYEQEAHQNNFHKLSDVITYSVSRSEVIEKLTRQLERVDAVETERNRLERHDRFPVKACQDLADRAFLAECQGHHEAAERLYQESLSVHAYQLCDTHPHKRCVLNSLAKLYCRQNRYLEAEPLLQQALHLQLQIDAEDELVGEVAHQLAQIYQHQQRYAEADELFQRAFGLFNRLFGIDHPRTQTVYRDLISLLTLSIEIGKFEELNAGSTPLDLDNLSEVHSWARPAWQQ